MLYTIQINTHNTEKMLPGSDAVCGSKYRMCRTSFLLNVVCLNEVDSYSLAIFAECCIKSPRILCNSWNYLKAGISMKGNFTEMTMNLKFYPICEQFYFKNQENATESRKTWTKKTQYIKTECRRQIRHNLITLNSHLFSQRLRPKAV